MNGKSPDIESNETPTSSAGAFIGATFVAAWAVVPLWMIFTNARPERISFLWFSLFAAIAIAAAWLFRRALRTASDVSRNGRAHLRLAATAKTGGALDGVVVLERVPQTLHAIRFELFCLRGSTSKQDEDWTYTRVWSADGSAPLHLNGVGGEATLRIAIPDGLPPVQRLDSIDRRQEVCFQWQLLIWGVSGASTMKRSFDVPVSADQAPSKLELLSVPQGEDYDPRAPRPTSDADVAGSWRDTIVVVALILVIAWILSALHERQLHRSQAKRATSVAPAKFASMPPNPSMQPTSQTRLAAD